MRDYLVLAIIFGSLPICIIRPYIGILVWSWISYMNPHRLTWGPAFFFPVAKYVGLATLLGFIFTSEQKKLPLVRETILIFLLWTVFTVSSILAFYPDKAWDHWNQTSKILLMTIITTCLITDRARLRNLLLTIAFSIGFYGLKGGIFGLLTGGEFRVWGPPYTFIEDNNALALALLVVAPITFYLAREEKNWKLKLALRITFFLSILSIILSYSRGALLGLIAITAMFLIKIRKISLVIGILIGACLLFAFIPEQWFERMSTIKTYEQDASAMGRINAWYFAWNIARERPFFGGGFGVFDPRLFIIYAPEPYNFHDAHSIYFEMLGEQGFTGLVLFLTLLTSSFLSTRKLKKTVKHIPSLEWIGNYSDMLELSLYAYIVSGAFLGLAYFDLSYHIISLVIILKALAKKELKLLADKEKRIQAGKEMSRQVSGVSTQAL
ncbi:MAG TPA: putative O-glycosylation ligase, exosortase A system-associated [Candidatus Limnocylindrales bacterium]|nr:putative O-glycosylation ligase, exosortase A system-associated [Candidatus Limnocylindrales bacterium]